MLIAIRSDCIKSVQIQINVNIYNIRKTLIISSFLNSQGVQVYLAPVFPIWNYASFIQILVYIYYVMSYTMLSSFYMTCLYGVYCNISFINYLDLLVNFNSQPTVILIPKHKVHQSSGIHRTIYSALGKA